MDLMLVDYFATGCSIAIITYRTGSGSSIYLSIHLSWVTNLSGAKGVGCWKKNENNGRED